MYKQRRSENKNFIANTNLFIHACYKILQNYCLWHLDYFSPKELPYKISEQICNQEKPVPNVLYINVILPHYRGCHYQRDAVFPCAGNDYVMRYLHRPANTRSTIRGIRPIKLATDSYHCSFVNNHYPYLRILRPLTHNKYQHLRNKYF